MTQTETMTAPALSDRLKHATRSTHEVLDSSIMQLEPFRNVANYTTFLRIQHALHADVAPLYERADLQALIPGLAEFCRLPAVTQDGADLGTNLPAQPQSALPQGIDLPQALGWLYVVEGSNLGAAFLIKAARKMGLSETHGARHLAEAPEGRAAHWRRFKDGLNAAELTPAQQDRVIAGANAAFARVQGLVDSYRA